MPDDTTTTTDPGAVPASTVLAVADGLRWRDPELALALSEHVLRGLRDRTPEEPGRDEAASAVIRAASQLGRGPDVVTRVLPHLRELGPDDQSPQATAARAELSLAAVWCGDPEAAEAILAPVPDQPVSACSGRLVLARAWCRAAVGDIEGADAQARRIPTGDEHGPAASMVRADALRARVAVRRRRGDLAGALDLLQDAGSGSPADTDGGRRSVTAVADKLDVLLELGRSEEGRRLAANVLDWSPENVTAPALGRIRCALARRVHLPAGEIDIAETLARAAEADLGPRGHDEQVAVALHTLSAVAEARGHLTSALVAARRAHEIEARARDLVCRARSVLVRAACGVLGPLSETEPARPSGSRHRAQEWPPGVAVTLADLEAPTVDRAPTILPIAHEGFGGLRRRGVDANGSTSGGGTSRTTTGDDGVASVLAGFGGTAAAGDTARDLTDSDAVSAALRSESNGHPADEGTTGSAAADRRPHRTDDAVDARAHSADPSAEAGSVTSGRHDPEGLGHETSHANGAATGRTFGSADRTPSDGPHAPNTPAARRSGRHGLVDPDDVAPSASVEAEPPVPSRDPMTDPIGGADPLRQPETVLDRVGADRAGSDRAGSDRAGSDRAGSDRAGSDRADGDRALVDHAGADRTGSGHPSPDHLGPDHLGPDRPGHGRAGPDNAGTGHDGARTDTLADLDTPVDGLGRRLDAYATELSLTANGLLAEYGGPEMVFGPAPHAGGVGPDAVGSEHDPGARLADLLAEAMDAFRRSAPGQAEELRVGSITGGPRAPE